MENPATPPIKQADATVARPRRFQLEDWIIASPPFHMLLTSEALKRCISHACCACARRLPRVDQCASRCPTPTAQRCWNLPAAGCRTLSVGCAATMRGCPTDCSMPRRVPETTRYGLAACVPRLCSLPVFLATGGLSSSQVAFNADEAPAHARGMAILLGQSVADHRRNLNNNLRPARSSHYVVAMGTSCQTPVLRCTS